MRNSLGLIDPIKLAWLLRPELRRGQPAGAPVPSWFETWWALDGQREYPAWRQAACENKAHLLRPLPNWPSHGSFGMTPALLYLLDNRPDLNRLFDVTSQKGLWQAIAWFFTHGVGEYHLQSSVDSTLLHALDTTPPFLRNSEGDRNPELTWLMYFVWLSTPDLQQAFDLRRKDAKIEYLQWFLFEGVPTLELASLVSPRWRDWLQQVIVLEEFHPMAVPRAGYLMWLRRIDLQHVFNLHSSAGKMAFERWCANAWKLERSLNWIGKLERSPTVESSKSKPFGVNLIGFAFGELGIGEDVRMAAAACEAVGIPYTVVNINPGKNLRQSDRSLEAHVSQQQSDDVAPFAINIFCLTGFDTARVALEHGPKLFDQRYNIGWWPWELPVWPSDWKDALNLVDEIWAATNFTEQMYRRSIALFGQRTHVQLMPMAASVSRVRQCNRADLGLPKDKYLFLYIFDFNSYLERKNPFAVIEAFSRAFDPADTGVGLVLKTMNSDAKNKDWKRLLKLCRLDSRIKLLCETMDRELVLGLIQSCDAYVSLHRSEGFGRTLAEAMLFGKPVVATGYSGNMDFMNPELTFKVKSSLKKVVPGQYPYIVQTDNACWADVSISDAAIQLKRCRKLSQGSYRKAVKTFAEQQFSPCSIGTKMKNRCLEVQAN